MNEEPKPYHPDSCTPAGGVQSFLLTAARSLVVMVVMAAVVWPMVALTLVFVAGMGAAPAVVDGPSNGATSVRFLDSRLAALAWHTLQLVVPATLLASLMGIGAAVAWMRCGVRVRAIFLGGMLGVLLCAPMVFAFAWNGVFSSLFPPVVPEQKIIISDDVPPPPVVVRAPSQIPAGMRCVAFWAMWAWPIPAIGFALGWIGRGRVIVEAASLEMPYWRAVHMVLWRAMLPWLLVPAFVVFILLLNDYSVPHACGLVVYGTELLAWSTQSTDVRDALYPALPQLLLLLLVGYPLWRTVRSLLSDEMEESGLRPRGSWIGLLVVSLLLVVTWFAPMVLLVVRLGSVAAVGETWRVYGRDIVLTVLLAWSAGLVSVGVGLALGRATSARWSWRGWLMAGFLLFGFLPGSIVGVSMIAAYNRPWFFWIYDGWAIVGLAYLARYGWIGCMAGLLMHSKRSRRLDEQAEVDGAGDWQVLRWMQLPRFGPLMLGVSFVIGALAIGDVTASSLVRTPAFSPVAHIMIEKFHRFEDAILVALCLFVAVSAIPAALSFWFLIRRNS
ncbi:MAG: hypothetical protein ACPGXK_11540 [Phycisphaerae bacterium]